jgi:putative membrane protein
MYGCSFTGVSTHWIRRADSIHLKQCVTLYLFSLPFILVKELGWATVPVVTVVAFTFMGIEGIAEIIEMPFGMCFHAILRPT